MESSVSLAEPFDAQYDAADPGSKEPGLQPCRVVGIDVAGHNPEFIAIATNPDGWARPIITRFVKVSPVRSHGR